MYPLLLVVSILIVVLIIGIYMRGQSCDCKYNIPIAYSKPNFKGMKHFIHGRSEPPFNIQSIKVPIGQVINCNIKNNHFTINTSYRHFPWKNSRAILQHF
jgi:hypothetical protein